MLRNYLIIALRNLRKQRFYAGINVLGLSLGIGSFLLILLYVVDELRYDRFYPQAEHIFRIGSLDNTLGENNRMALTSNAVASGIRREIPEAEAATRLYRAWETVHYQDKTFVEYDWQYVDS
ncbi:MAG: ABC transporter permease, partial [Tunicatimonas sp.]